MKKKILILSVFATAFFLGACQERQAIQDPAAVPPDATVDYVMNDPRYRDEMMQRMMDDPEWRGRMMGRMWGHGQMMRQMMDDPQMTQTMGRYMSEHPEVMQRHMQTMLSVPAHRQAMVDMLRGNPQLLEQMRQIVNQASGQTTSPGTAQPPAS